MESISLKMAITALRRLASKRCGQNPRPGREVAVAALVRCSFSWAEYRPGFLHLPFAPHSSSYAHWTLLLLAEFRIQIHFGVRQDFYLPFPIGIAGYLHDDFICPSLQSENGRSRADEAAV